MTKLINRFTRDGELLDGLTIIGDDFDEMLKSSINRLLMFWAPFLLLFLGACLILLIGGIGGL